MAKPPESNWKVGTGMEDDAPMPSAPQPPRSAAARGGGRRLVVTIVIIIVVAAVLGYFVVDILETATSAMKGR
ncbi:MAG: hypothetical protein JNL46_03650 [Sphingosinicella sp.]|nr:hypothetical protein [Sphingosinicella sp.]